MMFLLLFLVFGITASVQYFHFLGWKLVAGYWTISILLFLFADGVVFLLGYGILTAIFFAIGYSRSLAP